MRCDYFALARFLMLGREWLAACAGDTAAASEEYRYLRSTLLATSRISGLFDASATKILLPRRMLAAFASTIPLISHARATILMLFCAPRQLGLPRFASFAAFSLFRYRY